MEYSRFEFMVRQWKTDIETIEVYAGADYRHAGGASGKRVGIRLIPAALALPEHFKTGARLTVY